MLDVCHRADRLRRRRCENVIANCSIGYGQLMIGVFTIG